MELFTAISNQMVTDITPDEISYLAPDLTRYSFDADDLKMIKGTTQKNGAYEEFIVDEDDLYNTIIETFYEKLDNLD